MRTKPLLTETKLAGNISANYPDLSLRDPALKTADWIAQYGQAHISDYQTCGRMEWWGNTELGDRLAYAQGRQDPARYKRFQTENAKLDKKTREIDTRILKVVPKYIKSVGGMLDQGEYLATASPIDELADDMKKQFEGALRAQMENGPKLAQMGLNFSPTGQPAPMDEDELQLQMMQYKNKEALRLESSLVEGLYDCNYPQLAHELNNDNVIFGRSCVYLYTMLGKVIPMRIEPWRLFLLPARYEDFRDLKAGAFVDEISIGQLRQEAGDELDDNDIRLLASNARTRRGQTWRQFSNGSGSVTEAINATTVEVVRFGFMSLNSQENGPDYWAWYQGVLLAETGMYYGCKLGYNQLYDMENPGAVLTPFVPVIPDLIAGYSVSVVDEVMSPADFVQRQWVKLQDVLNRAVPAGYAYDLDRIEDVILAEGKKLSKEEVMELFERKGRWVHNGVTIDGTKDGNIGLRALPNGIPPDVLTLWDLIIKGIDLIERMTAVNGTVSGGNVQSRVAVGGMEIAKEGAINALKFLFTAQQSTFERTCRAMAVHYRQTEIMEKGTETGWGAHRFRMTVEQLPTKEEKAEFMQTVNAAVEKGLIDVIDAMFVKQIKNPRMGIIVLAARAKRKAADEQAKQQANIEATTKQQAQVAADKMAELRAADEAALNRDLTLLKAKEEAETHRAVLLAKIKSGADVQMEYYRTIGTMTNTALAGSWKAALQAMPTPTAEAGGATSSATQAATQAATLAALMPGMAPHAATLPPPMPEPEPPQPGPDDAALASLMGGAPQGEPAPADAEMMPA